MHLTAEEKAYLIRLGAIINGDVVTDKEGHVATDADLKALLDDARARGEISSSAVGPKGRPRQKIVDADYTIIEEDSDDSEQGYENQRQYRAGRGSNRLNAHRSGYSAPQTRAETEDVDYGYIPTKRENRTARSKLIKEQKAARKEEKAQKQRKISQYAVNEMKYPGRIVFMYNETKTQKGKERKFWIAMDYNPSTGKGLTAQACSTKEEAMRYAERMRANHGKSTQYVQKVAYTEPSNLKSNGSFKKKPASVYQLS